MEDAPYRNTRSSISTFEKNSEQIVSDINLKVYMEETPKSGKHRRSTHSRIPSGHLLPNAVGDIRNFFDNFGETASHMPNSDYKKRAKSGEAERGDVRDLNNWSTGKKDTIRDTSEAERVNDKERSEARKATKQTRLDFSTDNASKENHSEASVNNQQMKGSAKGKCKNNMTNPEKDNKDQMDQSKEKDLNNDTSGKMDIFDQLELAQKDPAAKKVMDVKVVVEMFKQIKHDLNDYKRDKNEELDGIAAQRTKDTEEIQDLKIAL